MRHRIACGDSATFQGNERDIVFLSMVADPAHEQSQTALHFEQRFNVPMSRARDRLYLVRSVSEEELKPEDLKAKVLRHFRDPMKGSERPKGDLASSCDSDFERAIRDRDPERLRHRRAGRPRRPRSACETGREPPSRRTRQANP
jgi:hypothetical protein